MSIVSKCRSDSVALRQVMRSWVATSFQECCWYIDWTLSSNIKTTQFPVMGHFILWWNHWIFLKLFFTTKGWPTYSHCMNHWLQYGGNSGSHWHTTLFYKGVCLSSYNTFKVATLNSALVPSFPSLIFLLTEMHLVSFSMKPDGKDVLNKCQ